MTKRRATREQIKALMRRVEHGPVLNREEVVLLLKYSYPIEKLRKHGYTITTMREIRDYAFAPRGRSIGLDGDRYFDNGIDSREDSRPFDGDRYDYDDSPFDY